MYCPNCQKSIPNESLVCGYCGKSISKPQSDNILYEEEKSATKQKFEQYAQKIKYKASNVAQALKKDPDKSSVSPENKKESDASSQNSLAKTQISKNRKNTKLSKNQRQQLQRKNAAQNSIKNKNKTTASFSQESEFKTNSKKPAQTSPETDAKNLAKASLPNKFEASTHTETHDINLKKEEAEKDIICSAIGLDTNNQITEAKESSSKVTPVEKEASLPPDKQTETSIHKQTVKTQKTSEETSYKNSSKDYSNITQEKLLKKAIRKNINDEAIAQAAALAYAKSKKFVVPKLHRRYKPLHTASFFFTELLLLIPIVNILLLFIWAFRAKSNANRKAFARSLLVWILILFLLIFATLISMIILKLPMEPSYWLEQVKTYINNLSI